MIAAIAGSFFIFLALGLQQPPQPKAPPGVDDAPVRPPQPPRVADNIVEKHKPGIISAIRLADGAEAEAMRTLDPAGLDSVYRGEALRMEHAHVQDLKSNGVYQNSVLENQDFQSFKVDPDEASAEVDVVEQWSAAFYRLSTDECIYMIPSQKVPQKIYLKQGGKGWIVDSILHDLAYAQPRMPCK